MMNSDAIDENQKQLLKEEIENNLIRNLTLEAEKIPLSEVFPLRWIGLTDEERQMPIRN
jgi:L-ribulokinase